MKPGKYDRDVGLYCPTCGATEFAVDEADHEHANVTCSSCGREMTRDELIEGNAENIDQHVEEIGQEVVKDAAEELRKTLQ